MTHATLVPQALEKSDENYDNNIISKNFGTAPGSTKILSTTSKASFTSAPNWLATQGIIGNYVSHYAKNIFLIEQVKKDIVQRKT